MGIKESAKGMDKESLRNILLGIGVIMGFVFFVSLSTFYIKNNYGVSCDCSLSLPVVIPILTSLGVFVGVFAYYFLSKSFSKEKQEILGGIEKTLNFLDSEEKVIMLKLIENKGVVAQNVLAKKTGIDSVKLHRKLVNLESKNIILKEKIGMTNKIIICEEYKKIFVN